MHARAGGALVHRPRGQYAAVDENLTAAENLRLVGRLTQMSPSDIRSRSRALLDEFGLADAADRLVRTFSGGMRRRLDLAAALVHQPPVFFLDEPTTGLDPQGRTDLWAVIERLVHGGNTVLLTTQYLEEADRLADRIVVIDHGTVIAEGTSAELKARLGATVIEIGFEDPSVIATAAEKLRSVGEVTRVSDGLQVSVADGAGSMLETVRILDHSALAPTAIALHEPTLDDVFFALTGHAAEDATDNGAGDGARRKRRGRKEQA